MNDGHEQLEREPLHRSGHNEIYSQSWLNQLSLLVLILIALISILHITVKFPEISYIPGNYLHLSYDLPVLFFIPFILFVRFIFLVYNERLVLTSEYMIFVAGRLSWRERTVRLDYERVQEIEIIQSIPQRLLGLGDIIVIPIAGTDQTSICMHGLRNPRKVKDSIRRRQHVNPN